MISPCYTNKTHCQNRRVGCHSECAEWTQWEAYKAVKYENNKLESESMAVYYSKYERIVRDKERRFWKWR